MPTPPDKPREFQFRLRSLFFLTTIVAVGVAYGHFIIGAIGIFCVTCLVLVIVFKDAIITLIPLLAIGAVIGWIFTRSLVWILRRWDEQHLRKQKDGTIPAK